MRLLRVLGLIAAAAVGAVVIAYTLTGVADNSWAGEAD